jgi:hypothetical protein
MTRLSRNYYRLKLYLGARTHPAEAIFLALLGGKACKGTKRRSGARDSAKAFLSAATVFPLGMLANSPACPMKSRFTPFVVGGEIPQGGERSLLRVRAWLEIDFKKSDAGKIVGVAWTAPSILMSSSN